MPIPWNLPFQPVSGSHTSKLMAGAMTPATRQNAGTSSAEDPPDGVKPPAAMGAACVMVVSGRSRSISCAQDVAGGAAPASPGTLPQAPAASSSAPAAAQAAW